MAVPASAVTPVLLKVPVTNDRPVPNVTDERFLPASDATSAEAVKVETLTVARLTVVGSDKVTAPVLADTEIWLAVPVKLET